MNLATQYDWIVLGDHPAALLSANLVARLGLSVLIVPKDSSMRASHFQVSETRPCLDPESNFLLGLATDGLLSVCLEKVGIQSQSFTVANSSPQALTPQYRVGFKSDLRSFQSELKRQVPEESISEAQFLERAVEMSPTVLKYWLDFPGQLTMEIASEIPVEGAVDAKASLPKVRKPKRISWQEMLRRSPALRLSEKVAKSEMLEAFRYGLSGQNPKGGASDIETLHTIALGQTGASVRGGMTAYRDLLLQNARRLGTTVLETAETKRIFVENGKFIGVQLSVSGNMVGGTGCVLGSSFDEFSERVSMNGRNWFSLKRQWPNPSGWKFTVAFSVRSEAIPPGASRRMVWKENEAPPVELEIATNAEYGGRDKDKQIVFLRTVLPYSSESLQPEFQRLVSARMFRLASELIPYLEYHVLSIYPDFRADAQTDDLSVVYPFHKLSEIPENLKCYGERQGLGNLLQGSGSGIEGLFITSNQSFPELGNFGPTVASIEAVAWIAHRLGLRGPLS
jgi:hypothetical protein